MGETVSAAEIDEVLSLLAKLVWYFYRILAGKLSNPDNKAEFQADLYEKMDPETAKYIISANHLPNRAMHELSTSVNHLPIFWISDKIDKSILIFEDTCVECKTLFYSTIPIFNTRNTAHFLTVWELLLPFGLDKYLVIVLQLLGTSC